MKRFPYVMLMLALLAGCQMVTVSKPPPPAQLTAPERSKFEGSWLQVTKPFTRQVYTVNFACDGEARVATVEWKDGKHRLVDMKLTVSGDLGDTQHFLFLQMPDKYAGQYVFFRYQFLSRDELVLWLPEFKTFADAVKRGKLKGRVIESGEDDIVRITDPAALLRFIEKEDGQGMFAYQHPMVLHKVADVVSVQREPLPKCK